ncbi:kinase-like domain-containing protein [Lipomyces oligophaga]|uniref:kinase-like domain-containing protein n=1 Tax=Lipomyces oligophaga TaxID=45792 RepID=UPI0034CDF9BF
MASLSAAAPGSTLNSPLSASVPTDCTLEDIQQWNEARVGEWLASVGCAKYGPIFTQHHIDGTALLEIDSNAVKELGVSKVGDRVRIYVAIRALRTKVMSTTSSVSNTAAKPAIPISLSSAPDTSKQQQQSQAPVLVTFIFTKGHMKIADISGCFNAESLIKKGIRKFGCKDSPADWTVFVTAEAGNVRELTNVELVRVCFSPDRSEREALMLVRNGSTPDVDQYHRSLQIARDVYAQGSGSSTTRSTFQHQQQVLSPSTPSFPNTRYPVTTQSIAQTSQNSTSTSQVPPPLTSSQSVSTPLSGRSESALPSLPQEPEILEDDDQLTADLPRQRRMRDFFGQRPPSELISSNLAQYFPGHENRVLEQTVRNSIRRSKRLSGLSRRLSVATTSSYSSTYPDALTQVPTVGDAWLSQRSSQSSSSVPFTATSPQMSAQNHSRPISVFRRTPRTRSFASSLILVDDDDETDAHSTRAPSIDQPRSPTNISGPLNDESDLPTSAVEKSFSDFSQNHTTTSGASDNNSYIEVDNDAEVTGENLDLEAYNDVDGGPTRWIKGALIGSGSFGTVVLGLNALTGELMAVKQVEIMRNDKQGDQARKKSMMDALQREIALLRDLQHENIVQYLGSNSDGQYLNIFLEYVPGGSVASLLNNYGPLEEPLIRIFVRQILCGLNYLHDKDIIHRDIKGANVLVDNKGKIKISDFGISKKVEAGLLASGSNQHHRPSLQGSIYWMAPEVVKQTSYTRKADIWSVGCLVVEMFTGTHPFPEFSQMQALFKIGTLCSPEIPNVATSDAQDFLSKTFELDHEKRPTAAELLGHSFLNQIVGVGTPTSNVLPRSVEVMMPSLA